MLVIKSPEKLSAITGKVKKSGKTIGFIPTMGALHEGHLSLIKEAGKENRVVVVSIFVNPIQFGRGEDLNKYPRPLNRDLSLCRKAGVDLVFLPRVKDIYGEGFKTFVTVEGLSKVLCGVSRPGHFRGVTTVVAKLFNLVGASSAYFGQKDAQQAVIISRMVKDLNIPIKIKLLPTVRETDGLALSSRNIYLNKIQRQDATVLYQALQLAKRLIKEGERNCAKIIGKMRRLINSKRSAVVDYIAIVSREDLRPLDKIAGNCLVALAVKFGKTRLIDNININA